MHTYGQLTGSVCRCMICARMRNAALEKNAWVARPDDMAAAETALAKAKLALDAAVQAEREARDAKETIIEEVNA